MKRETICMTAAIAVALVLWCLLSVAVAEINQHLESIAKLKQAAIDHGYAKHDEKTGVWMWIENKQLTKEPDHE